MLKKSSLIYSSLVVAIRGPLQERKLLSSHMVFSHHHFHNSTAIATLASDASVWLYKNWVWSYFGQAVSEDRWPPARSIF